LKFLKWFGLTILGFLLFISLSVFGIAFTVKSTVANPGFIAREIEKIPVSTLVNEALDTNSDTGGQDYEVNISPEVTAAIEQTIADMEPELKQETGQAVGQVYDYLLGKKPAPELASTIRNTVLSDKFVDSVIDKLPLADLVSNMVTDQLNKANIPPEAMLLEDYIQPALSQAEPEFKSQLKSDAPQVIDYMLGNTQSLNVTIDLQPVIDSLKNSAKGLLLNPPPLLAAAIGPVGLQQISANPDAYIEMFFGPVLDNVESTIPINETTFGTDTSAQIADGIRQAEDGLAQARPYVAMFNTYYILLILFILILIGGIIAIHHSVKGATRSLGSLFLSYGIVEFGGLLLARLLFQSMAIPKIQSQEFVNGRPMPPELVSFIRQIFYDVTSPLFYFSMGVLIAGVVLMVVSFVYRSRRPVIEAVKQ